MWTLMMLQVVQAKTVPGQLGIRVNAAVQPMAPSWTDEQPQLRFEPEYVVDGSVLLGKTGWWGLRWEEDPIKPLRSRSVSILWGLRSNLPESDEPHRRYGYGRVGTGIALAEHMRPDDRSDRVEMTALQVAPSAGIGLPLWKDTSLELGIEAQMQWALEAKVVNTAPESGFSFATVGLSTGIVFGP